MEFTTSQSKGGMTVFLWCCWYVNDEWCCYVISPTRGRAKSLFQDYWREGEYTDVRCYKVKEAPGMEQGVYDTTCPELEALGVRYQEETEE